MANTKVTKILMRNGTQQEWINADSVAALEIGEIGFESDTYRMKIGNTDNSTVGSLYKDLDYLAAGIVSIQEVDATHENGLMINDGKLELDIGQLVGRVNQYDSVFSDHADSIEALRAGFDTVSQLLDSIEVDHHDSILILIDSITTNIDGIDSLNVRVDSVAESIDALSDSIEALEIELDAKVSKAGDTMFGTLSFEPDGIIRAGTGSNIYLRDDLTLINSPLIVDKDSKFFGDNIETNDSYVASDPNDVIDVKSLPALSHDQNRIFMRDNIYDGGKLWRSLTPDKEDRIIYRPSVPLKEQAEVARDLLDSLSTPTDSVTAEVIDIIRGFMDYIVKADTVDSSSYDLPVEFETD